MQFVSMLMPALEQKVLYGGPVIYWLYEISPVVRNGALSAIDRKMNYI